ncbi:MAG: hypothetical protein B0D92_04300 [Spirochaeta sp. LUC14_002_19_P3]|nr:MAG: hypothetical protein B0D92_04300 [Spirochaeta sp. LUC14_002_19_P3]
MEISSQIEQIAKKHNWTVQPLKDFRELIETGLEQNLVIYGALFCPCRDTDEAKDKDIICPCVYAHADMTEYGQCYCGLFVTEEVAALGKEPESIPDRQLKSGK